MCSCSLISNWNLVSPIPPSRIHRRCRRRRRYHWAISYIGQILTTSVFILGIYSLPMKITFIFLTTAYVALVGALNTLSDEFANTPDSIRVVMQSVPSTCVPTITRSCVCRDGLYITKVSALLQQPDSGCSDSDKINLFQDFISRCGTLKIVTV